MPDSHNIDRIEISIAFTTDLINSPSEIQLSVLNDVMKLLNTLKSTQNLSTNTSLGVLDTRHIRHYCSNGIFLSILFCIEVYPVSNAVL